MITRENIILIRQNYKIQLRQLGVKNIGLFGSCLYMSKRAFEFLKHVSDEGSFVIPAGKGLLNNDFLNDEILKRAVVRSLELLARHYNSREL